ncbi:MAG: phosphatase PAP2 family protein [Actinobacteria bacterium]|nr:phosphatase PAP2 family protein [Actinomycetota bacterium]
MENNKHFKKWGFLITALFSFGAFILLAFFIKKNPLYKWDLVILSFIQSFNTSFLDKFMIVIAFFGTFKGVLFILIPLTVFFIFRLKIKEIIFMLLSLIPHSATIFIKEWIKRPRPDTSFFRVLIDGYKDYGFPSGHSVMAVSFFGLIIFFVYLKIKSSFLRFILLLLLSLLIFMICFGRLYLGVHFLSDVLGGIFLGSFWLFLLIFVWDVLGEE